MVVADKAWLSIASERASPLQPPVSMLQATQKSCLERTKQMDSAMDFERVVNIEDGGHGGASFLVIQHVNGSHGSVVHLRYHLCCPFFLSTTRLEIRCVMVVPHSASGINSMIPFVCVVFLEELRLFVCLACLRSSLALVTCK